MKITKNLLDSYSFFINLLEFLSSNIEALEALSQESGLDLNYISTNYQSFELQAGLCDFLLNHEDLLLEFCQTFSYTPQEVWNLRLKLPGASD